jgi:hypothetical protein
MKAGVLVGFCVLLAIHVSAQLQQPYRFTVEQKPSKPAFSIISLGKKGLALIRDKDDYRDGQKLFELVLLDTTLTKIWETELEVNIRLILVGYDFVDDRIFLLFREGESTQSDFELMTLRLPDYTTERFKIKQDFNFKLTHFSATPHNVILGGYLSSEPSILIYRPTDNQMKVVPGFFLSGMELLDVRVNENFTFNVLISSRVGNNDRKLVLRTFDEDGVQLLEDEIELPAGVVALSGVTSSLVRPDLAIVGTYAVGKNRASTGIYFTLADPDRKQPLQLIEYDRIPHFLDYQSARRAHKIKQQASKARLRGRSSSFRTNVVPVRLSESAKGFALLLEIYQASSSVNNNPYANPYGWGNPFGPSVGPGWTPFASRYYSMPYSFFDPYPNAMDYKMQASELIVLNDQGEVVDDLQLKLHNEASSTLEQASDFLFNDQWVGILYKKESDLYSHLNATAKEKPVLDTVKVELSKESEEIRNESEFDGGVRWWFQNSFYLWGLQTVRDRDKQTEDRTRYLFYINRVNAAP